MALIDRDELWPGDGSLPSESEVWNWRQYTRLKLAELDRRVEAIEGGRDRALTALRAIEGPLSRGEPLGSKAHSIVRWAIAANEELIGDGAVDSTQARKGRRGS